MAKTKTTKGDVPAAAAKTTVPVAAPETRNTPPKPRVGKLQKKNNPRLPRRQKKAEQKADAAKAALSTP
jgi:hypothetical protein